MSKPPIESATFTTTVQDLSMEKTVKCVPSSSEGSLRNLNGDGRILSLQHRLAYFYLQANPSKLGECETLAKKYGLDPHVENKLWMALAKKYPGVRGIPLNVQAKIRDHQNNLDRKNDDDNDEESKTSLLEDSATHSKEYATSEPTVLGTGDKLVLNPRLKYRNSFDIEDASSIQHLVGVIPKHQSSILHHLATTKDGKKPYLGGMLHKQRWEDQKKRILMSVTARNASRKA
jgi:hypothetical protein